MNAVGLHLLILLPVLAAAAIGLLPRRQAGLAKQVALWVGWVCMALAFALWTDVRGAAPILVAESSVNWVGIAGLVKISYHLGLDAISAPLLMLTGLLVPLAVWCSFTAIKTREKEYYAWMMLLTAGMFGVFAARDVLVFYVFFEFTLIPLYFLIGIWGGADRRYAANKFFLYTFVGSVLTFAGILYLATRAAQLSGSGVINFDLITLSTLQGLSTQEQILLFMAFFAGFAIKVPFFPLHTWLPLAHTEAPTAGSVLLAGVLLKLGTYGFLRFGLPMVPEGAVYWSQTMGWLAVAGIIYGALCSWVQQDIKKLVAYSSVSHLGFCMLGMFSFMPVGVSGSVLYMVNHGLSTGALFLVVGMIYERYHTRDFEKLGGLARQMPIMAFFLVIFVLSSIGLPGLNGFVSEFTVLFAAFNSPALGMEFGILGATGILLGAIYMLYMGGKLLFGPVKEPPGTPDQSAGLTPDLTRREIWILSPLAALCVVLGVYPRIITDTLDPALRDQIIARVVETDQYAMLIGADVEPIAAAKDESAEMDEPATASDEAATGPALTLASFRLPAPFGATPLIHEPPHTDRGALVRDGGR